jgi:uncharacterized protein YoxC
VATEKEEIIFELKVEPGDALSDMEKLKKSILQTKEEQKALNKALKEGDITLDEYVKDSVRLEAILKKQQSSYNNVQKSVTGVKTQLDKLIISNEKISKDLKKTSQSFQDVAGQINIAGTNVGGLATKLTSFANPATAAVGIVSALGAAYARSTIGAKDLEFAQNQLAAAVTLVTNNFAEFISSAEDGEGVVSKFFDSVLSRISLTLSAQTKLLANLQEEAEELGRNEIQIRGEVSDRLADNQEKLTKIAEEQTTYTDKLQLSNEIVNNLRLNQSELRDVLTDQLGIIKTQLAFDKDNDDLLLLKLQKEREINKLNADTEKKIQGQLRATQNLIDAQNKINQTDFAGLAAIGKANAAPSTGGTKTKDVTGDAVSAQADIQIESAEYLNNALDKLGKERTDKEIQYLQQSADYAKYVEEQKLQVASEVAGSIAGLFDEQTAAYKLFASAQTIISTYSSATKSYDALAGIPYVGPALGGIAAAAAIAAGLANLAQINDVQFAEGGWTGPGSKYQPVGVVHADEYVTPKNIVHTPAAQPHLLALENMRLRGYADGGLVTNTLTAEVNQTLMQENMMKRVMKNMPAPIVGVRDFVKVQNKVKVRDSAGVGRI